MLLCFLVLSKTILKIELETLNRPLILRGPPEPIKIPKITGTLKKYWLPTEPLKYLEPEINTPLEYSWAPVGLPPEYPPGVFAPPP